MWVFGDIAIPNDKMAIEFKKELSKIEIFKDDRLILGNLEGMIFPDGFVDKRKKLYNTEGVLDVFQNPQSLALTIANNHTYDYPDRILPTKEILESKDIECIGVSQGDGVGYSKFCKNGKEFIVFGHCWDMMTKTNPNNENTVEINHGSYDDLIKKVKLARKQNKEAYIVTYLHWNFDMEKIPLPANRVLARDLIDNGVNAVIGSHSHLINGGEIYKDGIIIYGLGNFFIADGEYHDKKKYFQDDTHTTLVVDIKDKVEDSVCYFLRMSSKPEVKVELIAKENFVKGQLINKYSPFRDMSHKEYINYYKTNRAKGKLLPIYKTPYNTSMNILKDRFVLYRIKLLRKLRNY